MYEQTGMASIKRDAGEKNNSIFPYKYGHSAVCAFVFDHTRHRDTAKQSFQFHLFSQ